MKTRGKRTDFSSEITLENMLENEEQSQETPDIDPLLALAGTLECEVTDIDDTIPAEMRQTQVDHARETQGTDPLLELGGTLECEVTDIGDRHNDYIGDTLIAELRGDSDESDSWRYSIRKCISKSDR